MKTCLWLGTERVILKWKRIRSKRAVMHKTPFLRCGGSIWVAHAIKVFLLFFWGKKIIRETTEDGKELVFDHGAPYFTAANTDVLGVIGDWEARGVVAEWKENFGSFDSISKTFVDIEKVFTCSSFVMHFKFLFAFL